MFWKLVWGYWVGNCEIGCIEYWLFGLLDIYFWKCVNYFGVVIERFFGGLLFYLGVMWDWFGVWFELGVVFGLWGSWYLLGLCFFF